ncbi:NUDIX domain-containing protein [Phenylobacterium aquaticum]|uniref:NUDIX hydrolase n=1 Tax=Phenylobacterium aquaticum TaxID=1763816 RepID=UPI0026EB325C|nr:NUDIX domain-containing protein [Phenylobacterium aquaticum]
MSRIIRVVAALIRDEADRLLTVRKAGTTAFMLPGGKPEAGEDEIVALARELAEELGCQLDRATAFGRFEAVAANEPDAVVHSSVYEATVSGPILAQAEIAELLWISPSAPPAVRLAPLLETKVLPALRAPS